MGKHQSVATFKEKKCPELCYKELRKSLLDISDDFALLKSAAAPSASDWFSARPSSSDGFFGKGFKLTIGIKYREILKVYNLCWNDIR